MQIEKLERVLLAYSIHNEKVGYCQVMQIVACDQESFRYMCTIEPEIFIIYVCITNFTTYSKFLST